MAAWSDLVAGIDRVLLGKEHAVRLALACLLAGGHLLLEDLPLASPRTQSALLEAMAAGRVSVDGTGHDLPSPFMVIATQNSLDQVGTSPLPESQPDRFLMRLSLGFPEREAERALLSGQALELEAMVAVGQPADLLSLRRRCRRQLCSTALIDCVLDLVAASRAPDRPGAPLSPRASQGLLAAARAWSLLQKRDFVTPPTCRRCSPPWWSTASIRRGGAS